MLMSKRQQAIAYAEEHRAVHEQWVKHWQAHPPTTQEEHTQYKAAGGISHHRGAIQRYDLIIDVLKELRAHLG